MTLTYQNGLTIDISEKEANAIMDAVEINPRPTFLQIEKKLFNLTQILHLE